MFMRRPHHREGHAPEERHRRDFAGNPYFFLGRRPFREAPALVHRPLAAILNDPYICRCGSENLCWHVLLDPRTLHALNRDIHDASEEPAPTLNS
jgi:hypothetical protein